VLSLLLAAPSVAADLEGSKDHALLKRYEGSEILKYEQSKYDGLTIALGKARSSSELVESRTVEGAITRLTYKVPPGRSSLEVIRNYQKELQSLGFGVIFAGSKDELGSYFAEAAGYKTIQWPPNVPALTLNSDSQQFLALEKRGERGSADVTVALYAVENRFWASDLKNVEKGQVLLQVDIVESAAMEEKMVMVAAEEMAEQISASGSIALYGIYFDTNKTEIKAESSLTLKQIAKLLRNNSTLKLLVVGHTDNVGTLTYNMELSSRRAAAVVAALTADYAINTNRLTAVGVAYASPVASNHTEEGRAQNRRVELVEE
jgi:outer membrane protein OmpA-like peptidoglycan-associated protein